jgi:hypothetical protein
MQDSTKPTTSRQTWNEPSSSGDPVHVVTARRTEETANPQSAANGGLLQTFGLDVRAAALTFVVDAVIFGSDTLSLGVLIPVGVVAAAVLGFIVYCIQRKWYGDDHDDALIKAISIGLLTALPVPITSVLAIPAGCAGLINRFRRK